MGNSSKLHKWPLRKMSHMTFKYCRECSLKLTFQWSNTILKSRYQTSSRRSLILLATKNSLNCMNSTKLHLIQLNSLVTKFLPHTAQSGPLMNKLKLYWLNQEELILSKLLIKVNTFKKRMKLRIRNVQDRFHLNRLAILIGWTRLQSGKMRTIDRISTEQV